MTQATITVKGMHCPSCEMLIKDVLEEADGVKSAEVSHKAGRVVVEFDDKRISEDQLRKLIRDNGYQA